MRCDVMRRDTAANSRGTKGDTIEEFIDVSIVSLVCYVESKDVNVDVNMADGIQGRIG